MKRLPKIPAIGMPEARTLAPCREGMFPAGRSRHLSNSAAAGAILLATGILENNPISIVIAALFLPFLSQVLALSFGL
jgi:hypothetical protein